jgi:hypothetical protein
MRLGWVISGMNRKILRISYSFSKLSVASIFRDCKEVYPFNVGRTTFWEMSPGIANTLKQMITVLTTRLEIFAIF